MKLFKILSIVFAVTAVIGLLRLIGKISNVNPGSFIFPAILAVIFGVYYIRTSNGKA